MSTDSTRLLVLGAVRQEQPASGYAIMRELTGWGVQDWASVNPGSIYGALRTLDAEGLVALATHDVITTGRSHKTSAKYSLTANGESAFNQLLRAALRNTDRYHPAPFMTALCFLVDLPRHEVIGALKQRMAGLHQQLQSSAADEKATTDDPEKPPHSIEFVRLAAARLEGELTYVQSLVDRLTTGSYNFEHSPRSPHS